MVIPFSLIAKKTTMFKAKKFILILFIISLLKIGFLYPNLIGIKLAVNAILLFLYIPIYLSFSLFFVYHYYTHFNNNYYFIFNIIYYN